MSLDYLKDKKDPDALDVFFLKTIELFQDGVARAEQANQFEYAHKARLMCIDVHKLRLLVSDNSDKDALDFTLNYVNDIIFKFPSDGRFWFQSAIINLTFIPDNGNIKSFSALNSLFYALLARDNPIEVSNASLLLERRCTFDFSNTLLNLAMKDFQDFASKDLQTWSFVKYFQSFVAGGETPISNSELFSILLFVSAFFRISKNSFHLRIFLESFLTAKNQNIAEFWTFAVYFILKLVKAGNFEPSDAIWFKIFQLLKSEQVEHISLTSPSSNYKKVFNGTILSGDTEEFSFYDFDEDFSIERDSMITEITEHFSTEPFNKFISLRSDKTLRLGSHFCEKESDDEAPIKVTKAELPEIANDTILDDSIEQLRSKLAHLSSNPQTALNEPLDYLNHLFILDTNVILSAAPVIRSELSHSPERFLIPLIVLSEIAKLCESFDHAKNAWEFLQPIISTLKVYNSYGRLLRPLEITQQLAVLSLTRTLSVNDDQIIELANQFHQNFPKLHKPVVITEDINMRLKSKSKNVRAISLKEFRNLCNC